MRKMRTLLLSLTGLLLALIVTACGSGNGAGTGEARIIEFSATGLTKGEGEWQLSWATDADSVQLNGQPVTVTGELQVQPEDVTRSEERRGGKAGASGGERVERA